ncbi:hypothetical protein K0M31_002274 [Melipona bicolor]|uniref:Uncharacterized protein n=1 Tax=Melipona bicolor TaxID=60889 RepID=A0AA40KYI4_9HYME|nr:hypothetical protein K0M31_002274 [Melipona bicolor]
MEDDKYRQKENAALSNYSCCSEAEYNTSRWALRPGSRNTLPCQEVPNAMAFSHLRGLYLSALRGRISMWKVSLKIEMKKFIFSQDQVAIKEIIFRPRSEYGIYTNLDIVRESSIFPPPIPSTWVTA